jgi:hypothetical protein
MSTLLEEMAKSGYPTFWMGSLLEMWLGGNRGGRRGRRRGGEGEGSGGRRWRSSENGIAEEG